MRQLGRHLYIRTLLVVLMAIFSKLSLAAELSPLSIGDALTLKSNILAEQRRINIYFPSEYHRNKKGKYPVLYMPDGGLEEDFLHIAGLVQIGALNWTMRPFILVGIENTERKRDLTGPTSDPRDKEIAPNIGGSDKFRAFIRDELMPEINKRYRTSGETAIIGESLAGLFVIETLLEEPSLFDSYLAVDPSLWWDKERLVSTSADRLNKNLPDKNQQAQAQAKAGQKRVYIAASSQKGIVEPSRALSEVFSKDDRIEVVFKELPNETHLSVYHPAALSGLRSMFPREQ
ncbi:alpha/beta hydrolase-fold protein [uncultured Pseudoteredinibacter sp.]|uniref:alpha/beta hydrolase n=1 Tax=uncultured Pseudoteredinibacter sp. TaxID=1641701 RepID=UPI0026383C5B|nr:alpha/beta hydrolase-fold protein [uncultured Pseudoteredinibacter sp.]